MRGMHQRQGSRPRTECGCTGKTEHKWKREGIRTQEWVSTTSEASRVGLEKPSVATLLARSWLEGPKSRRNGRRNRHNLIRWGSHGLHYGRRLDGGRRTERKRSRAVFRVVLRCSGWYTHHPTRAASYPRNDYCCSPWLSARANTAGSASAAGEDAARLAVQCAMDPTPATPVVFLMSPLAALGSVGLVAASQARQSRPQYTVGYCRFRAPLACCRW